MNRITEKKILVDHPTAKISQIKVEAADISAKAKAGEFIVLMVDEKGERVPLTIVDADKSKGTITLIFQELGMSTALLGKLVAGDSIYSLVGPLGHPTPIRNYGRVILVGGGVGTAVLYPAARALKQAGNHLTIVVGARTKDLLILENELRAIADVLCLSTDDGSYGQKGFTTDVLRDLLSKAAYHLVYAVGPMPMMRRIAAVTKEFSVSTLVSLNPVMVDGTGMCGGCRVTVGGKIQFTCIDGPEFDAHQVDWDELEKRNRIYTSKEKHSCKLKPDGR